MSGEALKVTPTTATNEPVFVFGTDLAGKHRNESAATAVEFHAAATAKGSGASGNAYAIPYRSSNDELLPAEVITNYLDSLFELARSEPHRLFQVARFGCEAGAHGDAGMARLFARAPANCLLPGLWLRALNDQQPARVLLFDPGAHLKDKAWQKQLRQYLDLNVPLWNVPAVEIVSVGNARAVVANDIATKALGLKHRVFGPNEAYYGRNAPMAAEMRAIWYSTHLVSIVDFEQTAQPQQIRIMGAATRNGLTIDQIDSSRD